MPCPPAQTNAHLADAASLAEITARMRHHHHFSTVLGHGPDWRAQVVTEARELVTPSLELPSPMADLLVGRLEQLAAHVQLLPYVPPIDFPQAIFRWARGEDAPRPILHAILFYYLGLHLLDDVHDDELDPDLDQHLATTASLTCTTAMPAVVLRSQLGCEPIGAIAREFQLQTLACTAGQFLDLDEQSPLTIENAHRVLEQRNGSMGQLLGRVAALAAGAEPDEVDAAASLVANLYIASQIVDDLDNLLSRTVSSDAHNLSKTLPLCFALETAPEHRDLVLTLCREPDPQSHRRLRVLLSELGAFHYGLDCARDYLGRGHEQVCLLQERWGDERPYRETVARVFPEGLGRPVE